MVVLLKHQITLKNQAFFLGAYPKSSIKQFKWSTETINLTLHSTSAVSSLPPSLSVLILPLQFPVDDTQRRNQNWRQTQSSRDTRERTKRGNKKSKSTFVSSRRSFLYRGNRTTAFFVERVQINYIDFLYNTASCGRLYHNNITPF